VRWRSRGDHLGQPRVTRGLDRGQLAHPGRVRGTLGAQVAVRGGLVRDQRGNDHVGEEHTVHVRRRRLDSPEPDLKRRTPPISHRVRRTIRPTRPIRRGLDDEPVAKQPVEGRVDLAERKRLGLRQPGIVLTFELITVAGAGGEQPQQNVRGGHGSHYSLNE
jgi:hypothetical protein